MTIDHNLSLMDMGMGLLILVRKVRIAIPKKCDLFILVSYTNRQFQ